MRPLLRGLLMLAVLTIATGRDARAGMLAACDEPAGFAGPVQVFVLQYGFEPSAVDADPRLVETARRLSYLMQLDVLANDSYGSIASILLQEDRSDSCRAGVVQNRLLELGALRPGQAVGIVWGRVYREGDEVLVQTYLRFLRVDPDERRFADERFAVVLSDPELRLEGSLPTQSIAFAPRRLSAERLDRIDADWREAARLYDRPDASGSARELPPPEERFAYFVREVTPDGWLGIELSQGAGSGWLKADPEVGRSLRELLPELDFVEGVIGYLSYRQALDDRGFPGPPAPWMLERIERRLARFIEPPADASALALTLLGALQAFTTPDQAAAGLELLREALRQQPEDGRLRNLVAMAELRQCCAGDGTGPALKQVPQMLLAGLAVDPNNAEVLDQSADDLRLARRPARRGHERDWGAGDRRGPGQCQPACRAKHRCSRGRAGAAWQPDQGHRYRRQRSLAARRPRRRAGRVRRGASRSGSRAFRTGMRQGYRARDLRRAARRSAGRAGFL